MRMYVVIRVPDGPEDYPWPVGLLQRRSQLDAFRRWYVDNPVIPYDRSERIWALEDGRQWRLSPDRLELMALDVFDGESLADAVADAITGIAV